MVFRIETPPGTKLYHGDRALNVDFDPTPPALPEEEKENVR